MGDFSANFDISSMRNVFAFFLNLRTLVLCRVFNFSRIEFAAKPTSTEALGIILEPSLKLSFTI